MAQDDIPSTAGKVEGPVPVIAGRAKPANSLRPRESNIGASQIDGPFGGKKPQS